MNLYLVSQTENNDYDTFDSFVCCAATVDGAYTRDWAGDPARVSVELIGRAEDDLAPGVVVGSYNAG